MTTSAGAKPEVVIGVDPGGTFGLARVRTDAPEWVIEPGQVTHPLAALDAIKRWHRDAQVMGLDCTVLIEDFNTGGSITKDGAHTLKMCGFLYWSCVNLHIPVLWVQPQNRMIGLPKAKQLLPKNEDRHAADALAHAIAFLQRKGRRR